MKTGLFVTVLLAVWSVLKLIGSILKAVIKTLGNIIVFLGLYIPLFYVFFGFIIMATTEFNIAVNSVDRTLFYVGLALCCGCSIIIMIRNLLIRPFASVFSSFKRDDEYIETRPRPRMRTAATRRNPRYIDEDAPCERRKRDDYDRPLIYYSKRQPEILVHEYGNRFELYREMNGELKFYRTEYKDDSSYE